MKRSKTGVRPIRGGRFSGRVLLLGFLLCAQLFMPAHVLGHELSMEPPGACAICPVGQNLAGVCAETAWHTAPEPFNATPAVAQPQEWPAACVAAFRSRAPPPVS